MGTQQTTVSVTLWATRSEEQISSFTPPAEAAVVVVTDCPLVLLALSACRRMSEELLLFGGRICALLLMPSEAPEM